MSKLTGTCNEEFAPLSLSGMMAKVCGANSCEPTALTIGREVENTNTLDM